MADILDSNIKADILDLYSHINIVLRNSNLNDQLKHIIRSCFKEARYQWCTSNANAVAFETKIKEIIPEDQAAEVTMLKELLDIKDNVLKETYPKPEEFLLCEKEK